MGAHTLVQPPLLLRRHAAQPDSHGKGEDALKENCREPSLDTPHFLFFFSFSRLRSAALKMVLVLSFCFQGRQDDNSQKYESCPLAALRC